MTLDTMMMKILHPIILLLAIVYASAAATNDFSIRQEMESIIIPSIEFRKANGPDVLSFLIESTTASDPSSDYIPWLGGVIDTNNVLHTRRTMWAYEDGAEVELPPLTLKYRRISLLEAIERVTQALGLTYAFETGKLMLFKNGKKLMKKEIVEPVPGEVRETSSRPSG